MLLEVKHLVSGYGDRSVINDVTFSLDAGEILAFFGHNGAGKSTTLKTILGLLPAREGEIWLAGERIDQRPVADRLARGLRLLPEGRGIFPDLTVEDNLDVVAARNCGPGASVSVDDVYAMLPVLTERRKLVAGYLSGGQQQMLALGIALLGSPRCILLEEPSVGLQPDLVEHLFGQIARLCRQVGVAAILIEHKIASAMKIADRVLIINSGAVVFNGLPDDARKSSFWQYF
jgi:ABC-type branched-subunit amino acid transport system ATPase component